MAGAAGFVPSLKTPPTVNGVLFVVVLIDPTGELHIIVEFTGLSLLISLKYLNS
jgi:hypothetical protein